MFVVLVYAEPGCGASLAEHGCGASLAEPGCCGYLAQSAVFLVYLSLVVVLV